LGWYRNKNLIASGSELAESFYGMGMIRLGSGQMESAMEQFRNCVKLQPNHANAYYYLGQIAEEIQDTDGAKRFYARALEINPMHAGALKKVVRTRQAERVSFEASPTANDLYALLRKSDEPVEQEIAHHLDAIAALVGTRGTRMRAFINLRLLVIIIPLCLLIESILGPIVQARRPEDYVVLFIFIFFPVVFFILILVAIKARNSKIACERDWLVISEGVLSKSTKNVHLFILSHGQVSVHQTLMNRITGDGALKLTGLSLYGYFRKAELGDLLVHFRQLSLLNPTSRQILAALGELKNIRSGAN